MAVLPRPAHAIGGGKEQRVPAVAVAPEQAPAGQGDQQAGRHNSDHAFHAMLARLTGGISPVALSLAYVD